MTFIVKLQIRCGEYEKHTQSLQTARTAASAMKKALIGECHNDIGDGARRLNADQYEDDWGGMIYTCCSVTPVAPEHVPILEKYLIT
jgi:hypothetical protein